MAWNEFVYRYDGTFAGFLTCVYESYARREQPVAFSAPEDPRVSLYPEKTITTNKVQALRVYRGMAERISPAAQRLASLGFLTCLPERERVIYRFLRLGFQVGTGVTHWLTDDRVGPLDQAVRQLTHEAHQYQGFVRFSDFDGLLAGEIEPKNRVLPLLRPHFCDRFSNETFFLYDRTHKEGLFYRPGRWAIAPLDEFQLARPGQTEQDYRRMWRVFYDTIAIRERENPRCRMTNMPKRYWKHLTEFQTELGKEENPATRPGIEWGAVNGIDRNPGKENPNETLSVF